MNTLIKDIKAREVLDSRGNPTVEVEVISETGEKESAIVPSGASTGKYEAVELRDQDKTRYLGKGVLKAVSNVNEILKPALIGMDIFNQAEIDNKMIKIDNTENKAVLGANAILGVSMAVLNLSAKLKGVSLFKRVAEINQNDNFLLPTPMMNIVNGGTHSDSGLEIQEFMIMPVGAKNFKEALRMGAEIFHNLKKILAEKSLVTAVGDEGGFAPRLNSNEEALELIMEAIKKANYEGKVKLALDAASSEFYQDGKYQIDNNYLSREELVDYYEKLIKKYPIISIEDGAEEDDWETWQLMMEKLGDKIQIVGDDLFVTNKKRLETGVSKNSANAILIKLNQIGTVTETIETMNYAKKNNLNSVVSHRSGETEDTTIADFVVGMGSGQIKTGSLSRTDRICKYNQLLRIEEELGENANFKGNIK
jgi:enolase